ncbi:hypothetical protein [Methylobacterium sp. 285MFTsu5.1]|uniref:hypothetical protein n=1 Tax=Methylobacterium sp. 285MFTsu5.1 TaxID=1172187 RepID=UPI00047AFE2F|nr:hypothetical protein [Methylobacterium sp. 285MFTsu5.1]
MFKALNTWVNLGAFRPNDPNRATAMAFVFHHIRPVTKQTVVLDDGRWLQLMPNEVSLIGGIGADTFICFKRQGEPGTGELVKFYTAEQIMRYPTGSFIQWRLAQSNLYSSGWDVFNGPMRITIAWA